MTRVAVVTFPGSLDDSDALRAVELCGAVGVPVWHASDDLQGVDAVILPGGFSYGDYLRAGAIARFSPIMGEIIRVARLGMPVLGICNGFQVLCESELLPGALVRNESRRFLCREQRLRVETVDTVWTRDFTPGQEITIAIKHGEGRYLADEATLRRLDEEDRVVFRYLDNPNGSAADIAGVTNERGNVVGLMPHPEHNVEDVTGRSLDGRPFFTSIQTFVEVLAQ